MGLSGIVRWLGNAAVAVALAVRSFTGLDTNPVPAAWDHVTKVDPENDKQLPLLYPLYLRHTDAISVGGSRDVDRTNTEQTFELLSGLDTPLLHEPSAAHHVTERSREASDYLAIPEVLNGDSESLVGTLGEGIVHLRERMVPELIDEKAGWLPASVNPRVSDFVASWLLESAVFEAYIIQNVESAAAREANVTAEDRLTPPEAAQRALAAEKHLKSEIVYLEYSGTYGGEEARETLAAIGKQVRWSRIWYGGGITGRQQAEEVLTAGADSVVVGNVFHEIAREERELLEQARADLDPDVPVSDIADWVRAEVEVEDTSAYRYFRTIPGVADSAELVTEYLTRTIALYFAIRRAVDSATATADGTAVHGSVPESPIALGLEDDDVPPVVRDLIREFLESRATSDDPSGDPLYSHVAGLDPDSTLFG